MLNDLAGNAELTAKWFKDGGKNLAMAAINAKKLGVNIETTAKMADSLLDFETSIGAEVEASVMIGRQLNLQRARQLALDKDLDGMQREIVKQLGSQEAFQQLNTLEQQSFIKHPR